MWKIAICDDNEAILNELYDKVYDYAGNLARKIKCFSCADDLLKDIGETEDYDIVFMDIDLGNENGIEIAKKIEEKNAATQFIFISAYDKYFQEVYEVRHIYFLLKPIKQELLVKSLNAACKMLKEINNKYYYKSTREEVWKVKQNDILYCEKINRKVKVVTKDDEKYFNGRITDPIEELDEYFVRCHSSYVVNLRYVKELKHNFAYLYCGVKIPISRTYKTNIKDKYLRFIEKRL